MRSNEKRRHPTHRRKMETKQKRNGSPGPAMESTESTQNGKLKVGAGQNLVWAKKAGRRHSRHRTGDIHRGQKKSFVRSGQKREKSFWVCKNENVVFWHRDQFETPGGRPGAAEKIRGGGAHKRVPINTQKPQTNRRRAWGQQRYGKQKDPAGPTPTQKNPEKVTVNPRKWRTVQGCKRASTFQKQERQNPHRSRGGKRWVAGIFFLARASSKTLNPGLGR